MATTQSDSAKVQKWRDAISLYDKDFKKWEARTEKILKRYRDDSRLSSGNASAKFNILWSNVQTVMPAVFSRLPKPSVSRRHKDNDPIGRVASLILERALEFEIEHYPDYRSAMKNSVFDRFLGGRGVAWVRYEPHISMRPGEPHDGLQITEDTDEAPEAEEIETLEYECAPTDYVHWKDFGHTQGRCWEEVTAVWRRVYMRRAALVDRFGEVGEKIPLDTKPEEQKRGGYQDGGEYEACIYEIWDKSTGKALWIAKSYPDILDEQDDPLKLESFFPCPKPLYATLTTDSLIPVPDFTLYQDQANTLDILCDRIDGLVKALQVKGCYDAGVPELARLFTEGENNTLIAVKNWQSFAEKKGIDGSISLVDLQPIFQALVAAYQAMEQQKAQVYEITGISDIVRGQGEASETATAQRLKGQYASLRLKAMQGEVSQFAAELLQLKAQIICGFFQPESIAKIATVEQLNDADKPLVPQAIELLKNATLSDFRIEVSADSLVQIDEDAEKESAVQLVQAVGKFISDAQNAPPDAVPFLSEMLKFAFARFKAGKSLEGALDQFADNMKKKAEQPPQPPPPDPTVQKQQMIEQGKQQALAADAQMEQQRLAAEQQHEREMAQREDQRAQLQAMLDQQAQKSDQQFQAFMQSMEQRFQMLMQQRKDETTLQVAEIGKQTTLDAAQIGAANQAAGDGNA